jgi:hypothetical protein
LERRNHGSAIAMVVIFLAIVGLIAISVSSQSSFVRKTTARSFYGFEAVEVCESAVNEAHEQVQKQGMASVFPPSITNDVTGWCKAVSGNDMGKLRGQYGAGGFTYKGRPVIGGAGELFTVMMWPEAQRPTKANNYRGKIKDLDVPLTTANAQKIPGFKKLSKVELSVLAWRRDHPESVSAWQDWGVLHYRVSAEFDDGKNTVTRTMHVDRLFSIYAHFRGGECPPGAPCPPVPLPCSAVAGQPLIDPHGPPDDPAVRAAEAGGCPDSIFVHWITSRANLKTVILRS